MKILIRNVLSFLRFLLPRMWYIDGVEITTGERFAFIWCGPEKQREYIAKRIFGEYRVNIKYLGRCPVVFLGRLQDKYKCSLAVLAGPKIILSRICRKEDICVPWWVDAELDIDHAQDTAGRPKSLKDDFRRIRKHKLGFEIANDAESYRFFYDRVYMPTLATSHGAAAIPSSFDERWAEIENGQAEVMFVTMNERPIGGLVLNYENQIPALRDMGILDGDKEVLKTGVITAANRFAMQYLKEKGFTRVCLGLSRCFLDDGVLTYKQKWRPTLMEASQDSFLFRVSHLCNASRSFLRSSSYIAEQEGNFHFAFFAANDDDVLANKSKLERLTSIYGIDDHSSIDLSGPRPNIRKVS